MRGASRVPINSATQMENFMKTYTEKNRVVNQILAGVRQQVLDILNRDPNIDLAFEGCRSNGAAAVKIYRKSPSLSYFRLADGARDMVLALACLELRIPSRMTPEEQTELFEEVAA
jgi:hypothetical protein